jgi:type IV pilus assembly protein PilY1
MSKFDLLMYMLIGGLGASEPDSEDLRGNSLNSGWTRTTPRYPQCSFTMSDDSLFITGAGCALQNPAAKVIIEKGRKDGGILSGLVDRNRDGAWDPFAPRIAIMGLQTTQNDPKLLHCIATTSTLQNLYRAIADAVPGEMNAEVSLGKAILRAIEYYKHICPACNSCDDPVDSVPCRKNFVLSLSGGDAADILSTYSSEYLHEEIRKAHTADIRDDREGTQVIQFFNISVFGSATGKDILRGFSKYGGFIDANGNRLPDLQSEWDRNGDNVPDTYFEATDCRSMRSSLERAFSDISARSASGTGVAMITDGRAAAGGMIQSHFLPVRRDATGEVSWTGYMRNIWTDPMSNLRDDSVHDFRLILDQDRVIKYFFDEGSSETKAALFTTLSDGSGGTLSVCANPEIRGSDNLNALWEAGKSLALQDPSARTIFTSKRVLRGNSAAYSFPEVPFPAFGIHMNSMLMSALNPDTHYTADMIIRYIRGECLESRVSGDNACGTGHNYAFRDRRLTIDGTPRVWKLGDIMNSTPKVFPGTPVNAYHIDYADRTYYDYISDDRYRRKSSVVFVGANDGMLHAFRGGYLQNKGLKEGIKAVLKSLFGAGEDEHARLGEEMWAYIPFNAFPYLKYLSDPNYCHINYSDLTVKIYDVSLNGVAGTAKDLHSWKTILIGGMRFGGACGTGGSPSAPPSGAPADVGFSSYFAIDVTDPENPVPLWEFSDDDMGYATGVPAIVRTGNRLENGAWHVVFGSGSKVLPKAGNDIGRRSPGYIYLLNLGTGDLVKKVTLDHPAIVGDVLAIDADRDYETEKIYFGTSYQSATTWMGKIMTLNVPEVLKTSGVHVAWSSSFGKTLFSGMYPFTASPEAAQDLRGRIWVYAGSGKYFSDADEADASRQIVLGMRDKNDLIGEAALFDATNVLTRGDVTGTDRVCSYDPATKSFRMRDVVTSIKPSSQMLSDTDPGWKIYLTDRERIISRPAAVGGLLDFLSYKPDSDPCVYGGSSYLYSVHFATGQAPATIAIPSPDITSGTAGTIAVHKSILLGAGAPPAADAIVMQRYQDGEGEIRKHIQLATGAVSDAKNEPLFSVASKIVHWLKK